MTNVYNELAKMKNKKKIIIIGSGFYGCLLAYHLSNYILSIGEENPYNFRCGVGTVCIAHRPNGHKI